MLTQRLSELTQKMSQRPMPIRHKAGKFLAFCKISFISSYCRSTCFSCNFVINFLIPWHTHCLSSLFISWQHSGRCRRQLTQHLCVKNFLHSVRCWLSICGPQPSVSMAVQLKAVRTMSAKRPDARSLSFAIVFVVSD